MRYTKEYAESYKSRQGKWPPDYDPNAPEPAQPTPTTGRQRRTAQPRTLPHRSSTGVWIPRQVWEDARFQSTDERILYLEVNHLDGENGCTAKNQHFADYLGCSIQTVQDMIHSMTMRGIFITSYPTRTTRIIHIAGGKRSYQPRRGGYLR